MLTQEFTEAFVNKMMANGFNPSDENWLELLELSLLGKESGYNYTFRRDEAFVLRVKELLPFYKSLGVDLFRSLPSYTLDQKEIFQVCFTFFCGLDSQLHSEGSGFNELLTQIYYSSHPNNPELLG